MNRRSRIAWIDLARAVGIYAIVLGHTLRGESIYPWLYKFHVPLCIMISGMCFRVENQTFGQFVKKKFLLLMVPYYTFAVISIAIYQVVGNEVELFVGGVESPLCQNVLGMLWANGETGWMRWNLPLWYLPMLFVTEIIAFVGVQAFKIKTTRQKFIVLPIAIAIAFLLYAFSGWRNLPLGTETAIYLFPFFIVGNSCAEYLQRKGCRAKYAMAGGSLLVFGTLLSLVSDNVDYVSDAYGNYWMFLLTAILLSGGVLLICASFPKEIRPLCYIGKNTMGILLMHKFPIMFFVSILPLTRTLVAEKPLVGAILISAVTIGFCLVVNGILKRLAPWSVGILRKSELAR